MGKEGERETVAGHNTAVVDERWRGVISILIGTVCPSAAIQVTTQRSGKPAAAHAARWPYALR